MSMRTADPGGPLRINEYQRLRALTEDATVLVVRVLHVRMLPELHLPGSEDYDR